MKTITLALFAVLLVARGRSEPSDTVESLVANPERLRELRAQCRMNRKKLGDELCTRVAKATNLRFLGKGTPYTPSEAAQVLLAQSMPKSIGTFVGTLQCAAACGTVSPYAEP